MKLFLLGLFTAILGLAAPGRITARFLPSLPPGDNQWYTGNRAPLAPRPLRKLPVGSIRPEGWLRHQLELEADGFTGHLEDISKFCKYPGSAWVSPAGKGTNGWEEVPYWLRGFVDLGYVLGDRRIIEVSRKWLDGVMSSQQPNGYFGSAANLKTEDGIDVWPNMVMLCALRTRYEATGDKRILDFMTRYFRWQTTIPQAQFLPKSWQKFRGGDNLASIYWLYSRTGDRWLLDLAKRNHERTADWTHTIPTWHGVNISQGFREPAEFYQQAGDTAFLRATERDYDQVMGLYGQVPGGMFGADENARPGYTGPRQGAETCSMAEIMYSHEMLLGITGNPLWADRAEEVAFNSFPAAFTPDLKGLHYVTAPNMIQLDRQNKAPMIENDGDMLSYNPYQYRCCQHNSAFGWPYYAERLWMAAPGNGLAATLYAASRVKSKIGNGQTVEITETTDYPFGGTVSLQLSTTAPVTFPLYLRVPGWTTSPEVSVNGQAVKAAANGRGWIVLDGAWRNGDRVRVEFPMRVNIRRWGKNRNTVSVDRGPLTYSLKIGERWQRYGSDPKWPAYEVFPTTPWNYALVADAGSLKVEERNRPLPAQPVTPDAAPLEIKAKARRAPQWRQEKNGFVGIVPESPVDAAGPVETVTLVPMGCARLRISAFPQTK